MARFEKGNTIGKGRPKGSKNKATLLSVEQILLDNNVNPIQELIDIAQKTKKEEIAKDCWKEISKYSYSQKKTVESEATLEVIPTRFEIVEV